MSNKEGDPDLFWALRGAAAAFGIVSNLTLQLHDVSDWWGGLIMWKDDPEHVTFRWVGD